MFITQLFVGKTPGDTGGFRITRGQKTRSHCHFTAYVIAVSAACPGQASRMTVLGPAARPGERPVPAVLPAFEPGQKTQPAHNWTVRIS